MARDYHMPTHRCADEFLYENGPSYEKEESRSEDYGVPDDQRRGITGDKGLYYYPRFLFPLEEFF